ncbi:MAG: addiction module protein [Bacteroidota bacterium]
MTVQSIEKHLLKLDASERAKLAGILLSSLEDLSESENETLWAEESLKRHHALVIGKAKSKPASAVFKNIRDRIR